MQDPIPFVANGNIIPSRAVMIDTTVNTGNRVLQATAGAKCIGVAFNTLRLAQTPFSADPYAAILGEPIRVFVPGDLAPVELGGTVLPGDRVKADAVGRAIATIVAADETFGIAVRGGVVGEIIRVLVNLEKL